MKGAHCHAINKLLLKVYHRCYTPFIPGLGAGQGHIVRPCLKRHKTKTVYKSVFICLLYCVPTCLCYCACGHQRTTWLDKLVLSFCLMCPGFMDSGVRLGLEYLNSLSHLAGPYIAFVRVFIKVPGKETKRPIIPHSCCIILGPLITNLSAPTVILY